MGGGRSCCGWRRGKDGTQNRGLASPARGGCDPSVSRLYLLSWSHSLVRRGGRSFLLWATARLEFAGYGDEERRWRRAGGPSRRVALMVRGRPTRAIWAISALLGGVVLLGAGLGLVGLRAYWIAKYRGRG